MKPFYCTVVTVLQNVLDDRLHTSDRASFDTCLNVQKISLGVFSEFATTDILQCLSMCCI